MKRVFLLRLIMKCLPVLVQAVLLSGCSDSFVIPTQVQGIHWTSGDLKVLVLGNSIALHGPDSTIGWYGSWGMAASSQADDFVHVLAERLNDRLGFLPQIRVVSMVGFEKEFDDFDLSALTELRLWGAQLAIIRIGDNVSASSAVKLQFWRKYKQLIDFIKVSDSVVVICTSSWFPNNSVDAEMRIACQEADTWFIDISNQYRDASNRASSERPIADEGVARHPGDKGMRSIADALWGTISDLLQPL